MVIMRVFFFLCDVMRRVLLMSRAHVRRAAAAAVSFYRMAALSHPYHDNEVPMVYQEQQQPLKATDAW